MDTTAFLNIATAICPDRNMTVFDGAQWTYAQINERVNRLGNALSQLGIGKGDRIGMLAVNCNQYIEAYFAAAKLGAIFVPLNFRAKADELSYMIGNAQIKVLIVGSRYIDMVDGLLQELTSIEHCITLEDTPAGKLDYEKLLVGASVDELSAEIDDEDITILMYTAGTTGRPKGVPLTHNGFGSYVLDNVEPANPDIEEKNILTVPLYHIAGIQAMLAAVYGGRTLVIMRQFVAKEWMQTVQDEQATRAMLVPTMLKWVIDHPDFNAYNLTSLQVITYGAASMPVEVIKKAIEQMPWVRFINAFGQTETASTITALGPEDHVLTGSDEEVETKLKRLSSSIGKPLSDVDVKIVDDQGTSLPAMAVGEIVAKGPRIMQGYWDDDQKTAQVLTADGWLHTGDKGWMDEDGYVYLSGRGDDMIIRGGENISPEEVENVLYAHPKVEEAAVIGVSDPDWGQQPRAVVVLKNGQQADESEIMEFCRTKLASFKRPRSVIFVGQLPRNQLGKLIKKDIREQFGKP